DALVQMLDRRREPFGRVVELGEIILGRGDVAIAKLRNQQGVLFHQLEASPRIRESMSRVRTNFRRGDFSPARATSAASIFFQSSKETTWIFFSRHHSSS